MRSYVLFLCATNAKFHRAGFPALAGGPGDAREPAATAAAVVASGMTKQRGVITQSSRGGKCDRGQRLCTPSWERSRSARCLRGRAGGPAPPHRSPPGGALPEASHARTPGAFLRDLNALRPGTPTCPPCLLSSQAGYVG